MERRNVEYFVAVSEHGSFVRAAQALHVTQPALSHGISTLESELGVELFSRGPGGSTLTSAGERILPAARQVLGGLATITMLARGELSLESGRLDLVSSAAWVTNPVAILVGQLRRKAPGLKVRIHRPRRMIRDEVLQLLRERQAEVAVTGGPGDPAESDPGLVSYRLADIEMLCVVPDVEQFRGMSSITSHEALDFGLIVGPWWAGSAMREHLATGFRGNVDDCVVIQTAYREPIFDLVANGAGVGFGRAGSAVGGGVIALPFEPSITLPSYLVHRRELLSPAAAAFVELARAGMPAGHETA